MTGSVDDGESSLLRFELIGCNVDGHTTRSLLGALIQHPSQRKRSFPNFVGFSAVFVQRPLVNGFQISK